MSAILHARPCLSALNFRDASTGVRQPLAAQLQAGATKAVAEVGQAALARLSDRERAQLIVLMGKVIDGLRRA